MSLGLDKKCFNISQPLFWRKEHNQKIELKLSLFYFLCEQILYIEWSACICTPCTHHCTGQVIHGRGHFLGNDDSCDRTLVIYIELCIYSLVDAVGKWGSAKSLIKLQNKCCNKRRFFV